MFRSMIFLTIIQDITVFAIEVFTTWVIPTTLEQRDVQGPVHLDQS